MLASLLIIAITFTKQDKTGKTDNNKIIQWLISQAEIMLKGKTFNLEFKSVCLHVHVSIYYRYVQ